MTRARVPVIWAFGKKAAAILLACMLCCACLGGCARARHGLSPSRPVTLTMWHNFGGDMQKAMDALIDEFNSTVGREQGIIINVTAISGSAELQQALSMIVNGDPGAPAMPDITTAYPKTAVLLAQKGLLADLDEYFTVDELADYVPAFLQEGRFGGGGLYVFPIAKSTEILYLNQTLFDRFSAETGMTMEVFDSFEGIAQAAQAYYAWTDAQTPDVQGDGKAFFAADSWINLAQAAALQQGAELFDGEALDLSSDAYARVFKACYEATVSGGFAIYDGYSSDLSKTGDIVCSTGSSAGILFYGDTITYPDNTVLPVQYSILPYPVFEGCEKAAIQRGNGFCVAASDETREYAAAVFLKWFTAPEQNMHFVSSTGYLPVTNEAFLVQMPRQLETMQDGRIKMLLETVMRMHGEYRFFVAPVFERFDSLSKSYEKDYRAFMRAQRDAYLQGGQSDAQAALESWIAQNRAQ